MMDPNWLTNDQADALHKAALALNGLQVTLAASSGAKYVTPLELDNAEARLQRAIYMILRVRVERAAEREHEWSTRTPDAGNVIVTRGGDVRSIDCDAVARVAGEYAAENPRLHAWRYATEDEIKEATK